MPEFLTAAEAARIIHVEPDTITQWCRDGHMAGAFKTPGGQWRIPRAALGPPQTSGPGTGTPPSSGPGPATTPPGR